MPKFITVGFGDRAGYEETPTHIRDAAHAHDAEIKRSGAVMGIAGRPVQVRNPNARGTTITDGSFSTSSLPVAGFALIEAGSLEEAIELASKTPCAVAHGVVEIWPLQEME